MTIVNIPNTSNLATFETDAYRQQLPVKNTCPMLPPMFYADALNAWNCSRCAGESKFCMPFNHGDIIPIQFQVPEVYHDDPENPTNGWITSANPDGYVSACLLDCECNVITNFVDSIATDYWVSYKEGTGSIQTLFVDTSMIPKDLKCFKLSFEYFDADGESLVVVQSEPFCYCECAGTVEICSINELNDCFGRCYTEPAEFVGTSNKAFYQYLRIKGSFQYVGSGTNIQANDNGSINSKEIVNRFTLSLLKMPPYFAQHVKEALFGDLVKVDGNEFEFAGDISQNNNTNRQFLIDIEAITTCSVSQVNCD